MQTSSDIQALNDNLAHGVHPYVDSRCEGEADASDEAHDVGRADEGVGNDGGIDDPAVVVGEMLAEVRARYAKKCRIRP